MKQKGRRFYPQENKKKSRRYKEQPKKFKDDELDVTQIDVSENDDSEFDVDLTPPVDAQQDSPRGQIYDVEEVEDETSGEPKDEAPSASSEEKTASSSLERPEKELSKRDRKKKVKEFKKSRAAKPKKSKTPADKKSVASKDKRRVLSYEDMPLDDSGSKRFSKMADSFKVNRKRIITSAVIIVLLVLCVLVFVNRDRLTFSNIKNWVEYGVMNKNREEHFPVGTDGDVINDGNFSRIDSNLVYASDTKFVTLNSYGRTIYSYPQTFSSPVLTQASDSDLTLVYNLGGTEFSINTLDSTIYTGEAENNILVADISKSGVYALVTVKDGYLSKLYVYSKDHKQIYAYSFADYYITSVSLDSNGEKALLTGVSAHDGSQLSAIYLLDFTEVEPVFFEEVQENVLYYADHLNSNYSCIIGENATYTFNQRTKSLKTTNYDGKSLTAFDINTDTNTFVLSLSRSGDGRMCDIFTFSTTGALKNTISTEQKITSISTYKNRIAALSGDTVYLYTKDGTTLSQKDAGLDPHCVVLYSTTDAYVLGVSEIRRIDL